MFLSRLVIGLGGMDFKKASRGLFMRDQATEGRFFRKVVQVYSGQEGKVCPPQKPSYVRDVV